MFTDRNTPPVARTSTAQDNDDTEPSQPTTTMAPLRSSRRRRVAFEHDVLTTSTTQLTLLATAYSSSSVSNMAAVSCLAKPVSSPAHTGGQDGGA